VAQYTLFLAREKKATYQYRNLLFFRYKKKRKEKNGY